MNAHQTDFAVLTTRPFPEYSIITDSDSYKHSHWLYYPKDLEYVHSYAESRGGKYEDIVFFGLQAWLARAAANPVTEDQVAYAEEFAKKHGVPFNRAGWDRIVEKWGGALPIRIRAVPEGSVIKNRNVLCTVENLDPQLPWLTSFVETSLLRSVWYASTVATRIFYMKKAIGAEFDKTATFGANNPAFPFALLDFSSRGCSSLEANQLGGAAYLLHFMGSDSVPAVEFMDWVYGDYSDVTDGVANEGAFPGFSIPATEHSVMCSWGKDKEHDAYMEIIRATADAGGKVVSLVSDTWDVYASAEFLASKADEIKALGVSIVFRPDSGDIGDVLPEVLRILEGGFGSTLNERGYRVLNGVKVLWGDGINEHTCTQPFQIARHMGISAESVLVGSGGGLMQANIDRDTSKWAFKASAVKYEGETTWTGIAKDPVTDQGKRSKEGYLHLFKTVNGHQSAASASGLPQEGDLLRVVFEAGSLVDPLTYTQVRANVAKAL